MTYPRRDCGRTVTMEATRTAFLIMARDRAVKLERKIDEGNYKNPIIFVAHGLGTILVKRVCLHLEEYSY